MKGEEEAKEAESVLCERHCGNVCHNCCKRLYFPRSTLGLIRRGIISTATDQTTMARHDEAADAQEFQSSHVLTIGIGHATHDLYTSFLAPLLPLFIANLSLSKTEAGLLTLFQQGPSLLQPALGHLADRFNLRYLVVLAPIVTAMLMSMVGLATSYAWLALLLMLAGISSASFHAVAPALAGKLSGRRNLGRGMALWLVGGEVGFTLGPLLVVSVVKWLGLKGTPWLMVIGMAGSLVLLARFKDLRAPQQRTQTTGSLRWWQALRGMGPVMLPLVGLIVARSFALSALGSYLPTFLSEAGAGLWLAGFSLTLYQAAASCGSLLGGALSDRLGRRIVLLVSMLLTPLMVFVFLRLSGSTQLLTLLVLGLSVATFDPVALAVVQENFAENRALASSVYLSLMFVIRSLAVVAVGAVGDWLGLRTAFAASAVVFLLGTPLVRLLPG